jgi:SAM-dependent methyltransferase
MKTSIDQTESKEAVRQFWDAQSCGEEQYLPGTAPADYQQHARMRYQLEPYISDFAGFHRVAGKRVLEIGVGLGADHQRFAEAGAVLSGIDLTSRAIDHSKRRLEALGLSSDLRVGDAENLDFDPNSFDVVYSWGVIHHSPDTSKAVDQIYRVLKPGGEARIMIYQRWSVIGWMLWVRYALLRAQPWRSLRHVFAEHLESPGTQAFSRREADRMFRAFSSVEIRTVLTHGDLLTSDAGQRHRGLALSVTRALWPRMLIRSLLPDRGLFMLIAARK